MIVLRIIAGAFRGLGAIVKWTLMLGGLAILAVVIVAFVGLGQGVHKANKMAARVAPLMPHVELGETEAKVRALLGKPDSTQSETDSLGRTDYWYYGTLATRGSYQLVFEDGRLRAKNRY